jgi:hypothetical protein
VIEGCDLPSSSCCQAAIAVYSLQLLRAQDLAPRAYVITALHSNAVTLTWSFYDGGLNFSGTVPVTGGFDGAPRLHEILGCVQENRRGTGCEQACGDILKRWVVNQISDPSWGTLTLEYKTICSSAPRVRVTPETGATLRFIGIMLRISGLPILRNRRASPARAGRKQAFDRLPAKYASTSTKRFLSSP